MRRKLESMTKEELIKIINAQSGMIDIVSGYEPLSTDGIFGLDDEGLEEIEDDANKYDDYRGIVNNILYNSNFVITHLMLDDIEFLNAQRNDWLNDDGIPSEFKYISTKKMISNLNHLLEDEDYWLDDEEGKDYAQKLVQKLKGEL